MFFKLKSVIFAVFVYCMCVLLKLCFPSAAMYELLKKKSRLFSFGSNNAFLEFFLEGVPGLLQTQMDSKKVSKPLSIITLSSVTCACRYCLLYLTLGSDT